MASSSNSHLTDTSDSAVIDGNLLVLVIDINPDQRTFLAKPVRRLTKWIDSALALVNSHLLLHPSNEVAVVAASKRSCKFLFPDNSTKLEEQLTNATLTARDGQYERFRDIEKVIRHRAHSMIVEEMQQTQKNSQPLVTSDSLIAGGLCMALSYINRRQKDLELPSVNNSKSEKVSAQTGPKSSDIKTNSTHLQARILVMTASGFTATQYMNYMNAFFTAQVRLFFLIGYIFGIQNLRDVYNCTCQVILIYLLFQKMNIPVDTCMLDRDSSLLQQGADITGGLYVKVPSLDSLFQFLVWMFLPDASALRKQMGMPYATKVLYQHRLHLWLRKKVN